MRGRVAPGELPVEFEFESASAAADTDHHDAERWAPYGTDDGTPLPPVVGWTRRRVLLAAAGSFAGLAGATGIIRSLAKDDEQSAPSTTSVPLPSTLPRRPATPEVPVSTRLLTRAGGWSESGLSGAVALGYARPDHSAYRITVLDLANGSLTDFGGVRSYGDGVPLALLHTGDGWQLVTDRTADGSRPFPTRDGSFWIASRIGVQHFEYRPGSWREIERCSGRAVAGLVGPIQRPVVQLEDRQWYVYGTDGIFERLGSGRGILAAGSGGYVVSRCADAANCSFALLDLDGRDIANVDVGGDFDTVSLDRAGTGMLFVGSAGSAFVDAGGRRELPPVDVVEGVGGPAARTDDLWSPDDRFHLVLDTLREPALAITEVSTGRQVRIDLRPAFGSDLVPAQLLGIAG